MPDDTRARAVARALLEAGTIGITPDAPVTFKSGLRSPVYVDNRKLIFQPGPWRTVIDAFAAALPPGEPIIAGVEAAGIPHSSALAYSVGSPSVFVRKQAKGHGLGQRIEGGDVSGRLTILIEDMITTGGSSLSAVAALREAGAEVRDCFAIITYGFAEAVEAFEAAGVSLTTLTTFETVVAQALLAGTIAEREAELVRSWLGDPHGWDSP
jgi:orotate phosphoribosyltransferase